MSWNHKPKPAQEANESEDAAQEETVKASGADSAEAEEPLPAPRKTGWGRNRAHEEDEQEETPAPAETGDETPAPPPRRSGWGRGRHEDIEEQAVEPAASPETKAEEPNEMAEEPSASAWTKPKQSLWGDLRLKAEQWETDMIEGNLTGDDQEIGTKSVSSGWGMWKTISKATKAGEQKSSVKTLLESDKIVKLVRQVSSIKEIGPVIVKVMINGAAQLRKYGLNGTMNPFCTCEVRGRPETKWTSTTVFNTYNPIWRQTHYQQEFMGSDSLLFTVLDYQKTYHPDTKAMEKKRVVVGTAVLDGERFLGDKAASIQGRNHGLETCLKLTPSETGAYLKVRIHVDGETNLPPKKQKPRKSVQEEPQEGLTPWQRDMSTYWEKSCSTPRIVPGQVLVPRTKPVHHRLHGEEQEKTKRLLERQKKEFEHLEELDNQRLLPWHHKKMDDETVDEVVERLYSDAGARKTKLQVRIDQREQEIDAQMGFKLLHSYDGEMIQQDDTDVWERLLNYADVHKKKKEKRRQDLDEAEQRYLDENSIHANYDEEEGDFEQVFERLHGLHQRLEEKKVKKVKDEDKKWHDIITHDSEEMLSNKTVRGIKVEILSATGLESEVLPKTSTMVIASSSKIEAVPEPAPEGSPIQTTLPPSGNPEEKPAENPQGVDQEEPTMQNFKSVLTSVDRDMQEMQASQNMNEEQRKIQEKVDRISQSLEKLEKITSQPLQDKAQIAIKDYSKAADAMALSKQVGRGHSLALQRPQIFHSLEDKKAQALLKDLVSRLRTCTTGIDLSKMFRKFDRDHSGTLEFDELRRMLRTVTRYSPDQLNDKDILMLMPALDDDDSGTISIDELVDFIERGTATLDSGPLEQDAERFEDLRRDFGLADCTGMIYCVCEFKDKDGELPADRAERFNMDTERYTGDKFGRLLTNLKKLETNGDSSKVDFKEEHEILADFSDKHFLEFKIMQRATSTNEKDIKDQDVLLGGFKIRSGEFLEKGFEAEVELLSAEDFKASRAVPTEELEEEEEQMAPSKSNKAAKSLGVTTQALAGLKRGGWNNKTGKKNKAKAAQEKAARLKDLLSRLRTATKGLDLHKFFKKFDKDGSGEIDLDELRLLVRRELKIKPEFVTDKDLEFLIDALDDDKSGTLGIEEMIEFIEKGKEFLAVGVTASKSPMQGLAFANVISAAANSAKLEKKTKGIVEDESKAEGESKKPRPKLKIKVVLLPPKKERQLYVQRAVERLYGHHVLIEDRSQQRRRKWAEEFESKVVHSKAKAMARPSTSLPTTPMTPASEGKSPGAWSFGDRLYNDAHRRLADQRAKQKRALENMHTNYEKDSVHATLNTKSWIMSDVDNVFERMYSPPPRAFQIKLGPNYNEIEDDYDYEEEFEGLQIEVEADAGAGVGKQNRTPREPSPDRGRRGAILHKFEDRRNSSLDDIADTENFKEAQATDLRTHEPLSLYYTPDSGRSPRLPRKQNGVASNASSPRRGFSPQGSPRLAGTGRNSPGRRTPESARSRGNTPQQSQLRGGNTSQQSQRRARQESPATARRGRQESPDSFPNSSPQADYFSSPMMTQFASPALTTFSDWNSQAPSTPGSPGRIAPRPTLQDIMAFDAMSAMAKSRPSVTRSAPASPAPQLRRFNSQSNVSARNSRGSLLGFNNGATRTSQPSGSPGSLTRLQLADQTQELRESRKSYNGGSSPRATLDRGPGQVFLYQNQSGEVARTSLQSARNLRNVDVTDDYLDKPPASARESTRASTRDITQSNSRPSSAGRVSAVSKPLSLNGNESHGTLNLPGSAGRESQVKKLNLPRQSTAITPSAKRKSFAGHPTRTDLATPSRSKTMEIPDQSTKSDNLLNFKWKGGNPNEGLRASQSQRVTIKTDDRSKSPAFASGALSEQPSPARLSRALLQQVESTAVRNDPPSRRNSWGSIGRISLKGDEQQVRWK